LCSFLIDTHHFCFCFYFFQTIQYFISLFLQDLLWSELLFFSEDDFVDLFVSPDNTYVPNNCITKHLLTSLCHYILFSYITVLSGFQPTSFINMQSSLATRHIIKHKRLVFQPRLDCSKFQKHSILLFLNIVCIRPVWSWHENQSTFI
jgi:hypothetical protein